VQRAVEGVFADVERTLADLARGAVDVGADARVQRALDAMPPWELPHESLGPESIA
jgi:hypothetical protein